MLCGRKKGPDSIISYSPGPISTSTQFASPANSSGEGLLPVTVRVKSSGSKPRVDAAEILKP
jgi:hypothetical protein